MTKTKLQFSTAFCCAGMSHHLLPLLLPAGCCVLGVIWKPKKNSLSIYEEKFSSLGLYMVLELLPGGPSHASCMLKGAANGRA